MGDTENEQTVDDSARVVSDSLIALTKHSPPLFGSVGQQISSTYAAVFESAIADLRLGGAMHTMRNETAPARGKSSELSSGGTLWPERRA